MRRYLILLALPALVALAGCGSTQTITQTVTAKATPSGVPLIPATAIKVAPCATVGPPCSAVTPEGAKGADTTQYLNGPAPKLLTLTGSSIHIDEAGLTLIENFEEVQKQTYCPYWDAYGRVYTRGFGETDWSGNFGGVCINHSQAVSNLKYFVETKYQYAVRGLGINLNQCQVDGLDSFVWNLGAGIFTGSLRYAIQHREWSAILPYDIAGGQVLSGLYTRRHVEFSKLQGNCNDNPPKPETPSQRRAREERELAGHKTVLNQLRVRQRVLRRELAVKGCYPRLKAHRAGPRCNRWKSEGNQVSAHGKTEDGIIRRLEDELR